MSEANNLIVNNSKPLIGNIQVPGDKSISHRSIILGALCKGDLHIQNFLNSDDCLATVNAMRQLGVDISLDGDEVFIKGKGLSGLEEPTSIINAGNSGTLMRLLTGILSTQTFNSAITGDNSLKSRPMARIIKPLTSIGAKIESNNYKAPIKIFSPGTLSPINYEQDIASAQVKSCLVLASLFINKESIFYEKIPTRDHTENLLEHLGYKIERDKNFFRLMGSQPLIANNIIIGSDISSASFFIVAALIVKGSNLKLDNININKYRTGILTVLKDMGADIRVSNIKKISNESVADIEVRYSNLKPANVSGDVIPSLIDELPILFIACAITPGISKISGIEELRHKESDRIKAMEDGLRSIGINVSSTNNSIQITGGKILGGKVDSCSDHRIAMSFAIAGLVSESSITITDTKNIATSFPSFVSILKSQGVEIFEV